MKNIFVQIFLLAFVGGAANAEESLFAEVGDDGVVIRVIVADESFISSGRAGDPTRWVRTYSDGKMRGGYAGIGHVYNKQRDKFVPPKPYNSWVLDGSTERWVPPRPKPEDGKEYFWSEKDAGWVEVGENSVRR